MDKVSLKLTFNLQGQGNNPNIREMSESLDKICKEIVPECVSYQATLENLLTGSIVEQYGRAENG